MSVSSTRVSRMPGQSAGKHVSACGATDSTDASLTCPFRASPRIASTEASPAEIAKELADVSPVEIAKAGASGQNASSTSVSRPRRESTACRPVKSRTHGCPSLWRGAIGRSSCTALSPRSCTAPRMWSSGGPPRAAAPAARLCRSFERRRRASPRTCQSTRRGP
eukprot:UN2917